MWLYYFLYIRHSCPQAISVFTGDEPVEVIAALAVAIVDELSMATTNDQNTSLLAQDLDVTNQVITDTLDFLFQELNETETVDLEQVRCVVCMCVRTEAVILYTCTLMYVIFLNYNNYSG